MENGILAKSVEKMTSYDLYSLRGNVYPGRGFIVGLDSEGQSLVQAYWIMGRSEGSRNRVFVEEPGGLMRTAAVDPSKVKDPSLIIYNAMKEENGIYAVTNGDQTDTIFEMAAQGKGFMEAMLTRREEPDAPHYTCRISSVCILTSGSPVVEMCLHRRSRFGEGCDRSFYRYEILFQGVGHCLTTYADDGNPLPPFSGDPRLLPIKGKIEDVAKTVWGWLNEANRVSLGVKFISLRTGDSKIRIINKYKPLE